DQGGSDKFRVHDENPFQKLMRHIRAGGHHQPRLSSLGESSCWYRLIDGFNCTIADNKEKPH
ncbi:MAG: hypothetical protein V4711_07935, partial [Pseudomonadota bacterium]